MKRKYGWIDKWAKVTGERAKIDAKINKTYIIYEKAGSDNLIVIDNSKDGGKVVLEINDGKITFNSNDLPNWALPLWDQF